MLRSAAMRLGACAFGLGLFLACASRLPQPPYSPQPTSALVEVPYPPPPAHAERVPDVPKGATASAAVWLDGEWLWQARRYAWKPGRWVVPPPGATWSPWTAVRDRAGTLYVAAGAWRDASGHEIDEPPTLASGRPGGTAVVSPTDHAASGPILDLDASALPELDLDAALDAPLDSSLLDSSLEILDAGMLEDAQRLNGKAP